MAGVIAFTVLFLALPAQAHATLSRSTPVSGATLAEAPKDALLWFTEAISPQFSSAQLVDGRGRTISGTSVDTGRRDPTLLAVSLPPIPAGTYSVVWRVLSSNDGHATSGFIAFTVGGAASTDAVTTGPVGGTTGSPGGVLLRWLSLCMLAAVVGGLGIAGPVLGAAEANTASNVVTDGIRRGRRRILAVVGGGTALAACLGIADLVVHGRTAADIAGRSLLPTLPALLTGGSWGHLWLASEAVLVVLAALVVTMRNRIGQSRTSLDRPRIVAVFLLTLTVVSIRAAGSHAGSLASGRGSAVVADALHVLTALFWLGALPAVVMVFWPRVPRPDGRKLIRAVRAPFTHYMVIGATVLVATGLYGAGREVGSPGELLTTSYGRTLLVKSVLLAVLVGLGIVNSVLLHGRLPARLGRIVRRSVRASPSRRLIIVEAAVGAVLLVAAGVLAETAPPRTGPAPTAATEPAASSVMVADLVVSVSVAPNRPGPNIFTVLVASSRRPPPAPVDGVTLALNGPSTRLGQTTPGHFLGAAQLDSAGPTELTIAVYRAGQQLTASVPLPVSFPAAEASAPVPARQLAPYANAMALCLLVLASVLGILFVFRRRQWRVDEAPSHEADTILEEVR
jgi:copper transport protein